MHDVLHNFILLNVELKKTKGFKGVFKLMFENIKVETRNVTPISSITNAEYEEIKSLTYNMYITAYDVEYVKVYVNVNGSNNPLIESFFVRK